MGGDEFAVLLPTAATVRDAVTVAERLVGIASRPIAIGDRQVRVGLSVGIAKYPADGEDPSALLNKADHAMYRAKRSGGGIAIAGDGD